MLTERILIIVGIASFLIPLVLSLKYNLATKWNKGEVRRTLVISMTVMYIILLSLSFAGTGYLPSSNVTSMNKTLSNSTSNVVVYDTVKNDTSNNQTIVNSTVTVINYEVVKTADTPISAGIIKNFTYIYVIIVGFYFGSRLTERIQTTKAYKNLKPLDILLKRYSMGEIDCNTFDERLQRLEYQEQLEIILKRYSNYQEQVETLRRRYTSGEIDSYTFDQMMKKLHRRYRE